MGFAPLEANSGGGGGGGGLGPLGQRQALFLFFSLLFAPVLSGPCSCLWGLLESLGVLVTIICLVLWPVFWICGHWVGLVGWVRGPPIPH